MVEVAPVSPDGVAPSQMVGVSASANLPLHHEVQKFSSGTGYPGGHGKGLQSSCGGARMPLLMATSAFQ